MPAAAPRSCAGQRSQAPAGASPGSTVVRHPEVPTCTGRCAAPDSGVRRHRHRRTGAADSARSRQAHAARASAARSSARSLALAEDRPPRRPRSRRNRHRRRLCRRAVRRRGAGRGSRQRGPAGHRLDPRRRLPARSGRRARHAPGTGRTVALTFDDGPGEHRGDTPILAEKQVRAAFFDSASTRTGPRGHRRSRPGAPGGQPHLPPDMPRLDAAAQAAEMDAPGRSRGHRGRAALFFRPPYGARDSTTPTGPRPPDGPSTAGRSTRRDWEARGSGAATWVTASPYRAEARAAARPIRSSRCRNSPRARRPQWRRLRGDASTCYRTGYTFVDIAGGRRPAGRRGTGVTGTGAGAGEPGFSPTRARAEAAGDTRICGRGGDDRSSIAMARNDVRRRGGVHRRGSLACSNASRW